MLKALRKLRARLIAAGVVRFVGLAWIYYWLEAEKGRFE